MVQQRDNAGEGKFFFVFFCFGAEGGSAARRRREGKTFCFLVFFILCFFIYVFILDCGPALFVLTAFFLLSPPPVLLCPPPFLFPVDFICTHCFFLLFLTFIFIFFAVYCVPQGVIARGTRGARLNSTQPKGLLRVY